MEYARTLLNEAREELIRADGKASILLAGAGVVIGALLAGLTAGDWSPSKLGSGIQWLWWFGILCAGAGIVSLTLVIYPRFRRLRNVPNGIVAFYGDVVSYHSHDDLKTAIVDSSSQNLDRLTDQVHAVSTIAVRKYTHLARALRLLGLAALSTLASVLVNAYLK